MADLLNKILRAGEGKTLRRLEHTVRDDQCARGRVRRAVRRRAPRQDRRVPRAPRAGRDARRSPARGVRRASARRRSARSAMRHFDVQLLGGAVLHEGSIAEMRTGEGKTLVATLPLYLNALPGEGVHLVTVNDYLARRDAEWMRPIYEALGLTVGVIQAEHEPEIRRAPVRVRHHLRHQLGVRLRLPARQPGERHRPVRPAQLHLRDRRRGRLDPDRRGAHAADHLGPARGGARHLLHVREDRAHAERRRTTTRSTRSARRSRRASRACTRSSARSRSRTCTPPRTASSSTTSCRRSRPSRCTSATSSTSCRMARSRSSTSSPAASWRAGAGRRACTRPSRRRRA